MSAMERLSKAARIRAKHYVAVKREFAGLSAMQALMKRHGVNWPGDALDAEASRRTALDLQRMTD